MNDSNDLILPVGVVCGYVKRVFDSEEMLHDITVLGEVSNLKITGGYAYFNLKDNDGLLSCACFGLYKTEIPKDGDKVYVSGSISFYPKGGKVSFIVNKISHVGKGEILLYYQKLKEKLENEGLFDEKHKKAIPTYPNSVCVVTSKSGAAIRDIVRTIRNKNSKIDISVVDVRVQGESAAEDIVRGITLADRVGADVVILARGGGSYEDLLSFCDERVVRAVYNAETPIISAVGHETDVTLTDYVADLRVSTPTAAGEYVAYDEKKIKDYVLKLCDKIYAETLESYTVEQKRLKSLINNLSLEAGYFYERTKNRYLGAINRMTAGIKNNLFQKTSKVERLLERINSASPVNVLRRGLYKVYYKDKPLSGEEKLNVGEKIVLESPDKRINAEVISVENKRY